MAASHNGFDKVCLEETFDVDEAFAVEFPELLVGEFHCIHCWHNSAIIAAFSPSWSLNF